MISIIIPVYNEEDNIMPLYNALKPVLKDLGEHEILFVDDGSTDKTFQKLKECAKNDKSAKIAKFRRNFGQSAAISYGFDNAIGEILITMDGDLQIDPTDIPKMVKQIRQGSDVVCGWRKRRKDPYLRKKIPSRIFNWLTSKVSGFKIHDIGTPFRAYRKEVVDNISGSLYGELHRYLPVLAGWRGYKIQEIEIKHNPRKHGKSKYGWSRLIRGFLDLFTVYFLEKYLSRPLHLFGTIGLLSMSSGIIISIYLGLLRILYFEPLENRPLFLLGVVMIIFGAQFITLGLIGEMLTKYQHENTKSKSYDVETRINFE
jgi:glycosyltransferase involved in cell wall biosynthesis